LKARESPRGNLGCEFGGWVWDDDAVCVVDSELELLVVVPFGLGLGRLGLLCALEVVIDNCNEVFDIADICAAFEAVEIEEVASSTGVSFTRMSVKDEMEVNVGILGFVKELISEVSELVTEMLAKVE